MLDETKKLIETLFGHMIRPGMRYKCWLSNDRKICISEEINTGIVEYNFDDDNENWISEEEAIRRLRLMAFW